MKRELELPVFDPDKNGNPFYWIIHTAEAVRELRTAPVRAKSSDNSVIGDRINLAQDELSVYFPKNNIEGVCKK